MLNFLLFLATIGLILTGWAVMVPAVAAARLQERLTVVRNEIRDAQRTGDLPRDESVETLVRLCELGIDHPRFFSFSRALSVHAAMKGQHPRPLPRQHLSSSERHLLRDFETRTAQNIAVYMVRSSALWPLLVPTAWIFAHTRRVRGGRPTQGPRPSVLAADMVRVRGIGITEPQGVVTPAA